MDEELRELIAALGAETVKRVLFEHLDRRRTGGNAGLSPAEENAGDDEVYWWDRAEARGGLPNAVNINIARIDADS